MSARIASQTHAHSAEDEQLQHLPRFRARRSTDGQGMLPLLPVAVVSPHGLQHGFRAGRLPFQASLEAPADSRLRPKLRIDSMRPDMHWRAPDETSNFDSWLGTCKHHRIARVVQRPSSPRVCGLHLNRCPSKLVFMPYAPTNFELLFRVLLSRGTENPCGACFQYGIHRDVALGELVNVVGEVDK